MSTKATTETTESLRLQFRQTRETIISLMPEHMQKILESYRQCKTAEEADDWYEETVFLLATTPTPELEGITESHFGYAPCPLCGATSANPYQFGFTLPEGLKRHLSGSGRSSECKVMAAVKGLAEEYFQDRFGS